MIEIFPLTTISDRVGPAVRQWPSNIQVIEFVLNDVSFTNPARFATVLMQLSWDNKQTWSVGDPRVFQGGAKNKDGTPPKVTLGPFIKLGVVTNPTHIRFYASPGQTGGAPYGPSVTIGLFANAIPE